MNNCIKYFGFFMANFRHNKLRNTGLLFEFLLRQVTVDVLNKDKESDALKIIKKRFNEHTEVGKELALYNLLKNTDHEVVAGYWRYTHFFSKNHLDFCEYYLDHLRETSCHALFYYEIHTQKFYLIYHQQIFHQIF